MKNTATPAAWIKIHPSDNIVAALRTLHKGEVFNVDGNTVPILEDIPIKHKFTTAALEKDDEVSMYGVLVGRATQPIPKGGLVHTGNVEHATLSYSGKKGKTSWSPPDVSAWQHLTFNGYHRANGSVGTANYWLVIPLVFCENRNIEVIHAALSEQLGYMTKRDFAIDTQSLVEAYQAGANAEAIMAVKALKTKEDLRQQRVFPNVDGVKFLTHDGGCGGTRQDANALCELLAGYVTHPNVAGATVLSLGCQHAQMTILKEAIERRDPSFSKPLFMLEQQQSKSERHFIEEAVKRTFTGLMQANKLTRRPAPLSKLVLGLECGGSDGFSGISANPALGHASDLLVALGGATILSEFPELNGVEQELINRCEDEDLAKKFAGIMTAYSQRAEAVGSGFKNNPSPGNIKDGLITDAIKSAGAAKKGGTSPVTDVLDYTEPVARPGLNLLCTPGNDVESTTGLAGSGATVIVFTTGLGTPTGNPVAPVIKVSTNNALAERMADIIDVNAGTIITGEDTIETKGIELLDYILKVASGEAVPAAVRLGQDDFIPWKRGVSL